jgi:hypothetical protein
MESSRVDSTYGRNDPPGNLFLARNALIVPLVILATVILSSRITRIVGIVYPIVIPALPSVSGTTGKRAAEGGKAPCS